MIFFWAAMLTGFSVLLLAWTADAFVLVQSCANWIFSYAEQSKLFSITAWWQHIVTTASLILFVPLLFLFYACTFWILLGTPKKALKVTGWPRPLKEYNGERIPWRPRIWHKIFDSTVWRLQTPLYGLKSLRMLFLAAALLLIPVSLLTLFPEWNRGNLAPRAGFSIPMGNIALWMFYLGILKYKAFWENYIAQRDAENKAVKQASANKEADKEDENSKPSPSLKKP